MMDVEIIVEGLERLYDILNGAIKRDNTPLVSTTMERSDASYTLNLLNKAVARLNEIEYRACPVCRRIYPWLKNTTHKTCRICFAKEAVNRAVVLTTAGKGTGFGIDS